MKLEKIISILEITKANIAGSYTDPNIMYFSDIDLREHIETGITPEQFLFYLQQKIKIIQESDEMFFIEFKGGMHKGKSLKWSIVDINNGYIEFEDIRIDFATIFNQKSIIKIEVIASTGRMIEFSNNWFIQIEKFNTEPEFNKDINHELLSDYHKLIKGNKYMKAFKRLYGYYNITNNKKGVEAVLLLLNSELGRFNQSINQLCTIYNLISNPYKKPSKYVIYKNIKWVQNNINDKYKYYFNKLLINKDISFNVMKTKIKNLNTILQNILNEQVIVYNNKYNLTQYI